MTDPKDSESFFRKVARFVANPTTDWAEINSRQDDPQADAAKAELRAMVERKRRNDFVRKRELDMLRRIRREGLSPEQLAALGASSSRMDEVERMNSDMGQRVDLQVKAKIDEIEQQMVGESFARAPSPPSSGFFETSTRAAAFAPTMPAVPNTEIPRGGAPAPTSAAPAPGRERPSNAPVPAAAVVDTKLPPPAEGAPSELPELMPMNPGLSFRMTESAAIEVNEVVHDAELDEAVIAFANADNESCERSLTELTQPGGSRNLHAETWLVLFDFYRATGQQSKFEALALEYAQQFGLSAPQWFSMPKMVAEQQRKVRPPKGSPGAVCWSAPAYLDAEAVQQMRSRCESSPMPWVLDWKDLQQLDTEGCAKLQSVFKDWSKQVLDIRWLAGDQFLQVIKDMAPVGVRDVDPALWMLRMEALRLVNRPDQFDEAAIDYCVTYEVSPPSWEKAKCLVRVSGNSLSTQGPTSTTQQQALDAQSTFLETSLGEQTKLGQAVQLELSGQLHGDISETLNLMSGELGAASLIEVSCPALIRLDFLAAGDLLNWVLSRRSENRNVVFKDTHRLVALFFGAMGINEHARVKVRTV
ncbi:STAS domain-containing protein [Roseateles flavus]|uniref:STAS domain-containing protein n=1 Tax=Roseateles flavus TaxID=3149041 RepID=A0ABV0GKW2_9BURK